MTTSTTPSVPAVEVPDAARLAGDIVGWLTEWLLSAERDWHDHPTEPGLGWYGSGFNNWGVQTNQKYVAAAATVAALGGDDVVAELAARRAAAALRFSVWSHRSGGGRCADGQPWGHTWISVLGIERMMFAVDLLDPWLTAADRHAVDELLVSESRWINSDFHRGEAARGVVGDRWNDSGRNVPESNLWNGALLWRTAMRCPNDPDAPAWRELAIRFLINSVSVLADADDATVVDGRPVAERHAGANFFDSYALDHHGYLNVGYMAICVSNAAILHFDLRRRGEPAPDALHHHQRDLWQLVRRLVSTDGRLLRIGGDSRVRYTYCQEYLMPSLLYAADRHRDPHAFSLLRAELRQLRDEQQANADGSFYSHRLDHLRRTSPYYFTRLESDRACALAFTAVYLPQTRFPDPASDSAASFASSVSGGWADHEHAAVLHRSPTRFASYAWRANGLSQGLCLPPDAGDLAEWDLNLAPEVIIEGAPRQAVKFGVQVSRVLELAEVREFDGGFLTWGRVAEGAEMIIQEGWSGGPAAFSDIVVAALPDQQTMIGIHLVRTGDHHAGVVSAKGLHLGVPNDVANGGSRRLMTAIGAVDLIAGDEGDLELGAWANVDDRLGVVGLYGGDGLALSRSRVRRGGPLQSLYVEEVCLPHQRDHRYVPPRTTVLDSGWAVLSDASAATTDEFARANTGARIELADGVRGLRIASQHARYVLLSNAGDVPITVPLLGPHRDLVRGGQPVDRVEVADGGAVLLQDLTG